jgi:Holliday junction resolvase
MEARRLRALERNNPTLIAAIPLAVEPMPAPNVLDAALIAPTLAQFGLSDDAVRRLPKPWFQSPPKARVIGAYFFMHTVVLLIVFRNIQYSFATVFLFLAFLFVTITPFAILWGAMGWAETQLYLRLHRNFARYSQYRNAVAMFERRKREHEESRARQQAQYWRSLSGVAFERELGKLFSIMGYAVSHTPSTADGGVDLLLRKDGNLTVVQCKAHNKPISISVARELFASMMDFKADDAIIACFEGVTKPVADYIKTKRITVMTVNDIIVHQMNHG